MEVTNLLMILTFSIEYCFLDDLLMRAEIGEVLTIDLKVVLFLEEGGCNKKS